MSIARRRFPSAAGAATATFPVSPKTRAETLPDVPPLADFVPGYEMSTWYGIGAPAKHTRRDRRQAQRGDQCGDPKFKVRAADLGGTMLGGSPSTLAQLVTDESEKWAKVVKFAGLTPI